MIQPLPRKESLKERRNACPVKRVAYFTGGDIRISEIG